MTTYGLIFIVFIVQFPTFHAQSISYQCSCGCCNTPGCIPSLTGYTQSVVCSSEACLTQCRCAFSQCLTSPPYGQAAATCLSTIPPQGLCNCWCCNTGTTSCQVNNVGTAVAGTCTPEACSIACYLKYPGQCVANQTGQTIGSCTSPLTTTTTMSTTLPLVWLGNICVCTFCQSSLACYSPIFLGATSSAQCSTSSCTQVCQSRFAPICTTTTYQGQVTGVCPSLAIGNVRCRCNCCGSLTGCIDYELNINGSCSSCQGACQQVSPCGNLYGATAICSYNSATSFVSISSITLFVFTVIFIRFSFVQDFNQ